MSTEPLSRDAATLAHMNALIFQLCVSAMAGWVNRGQQQVIEYLVEENRVLREQLGGRRLRLPANTNADGSIQCRERLGGTLKYYYRDAA